MDHVPARPDLGSSLVDGTGGTGTAWRVDLVGEGMARRLERWAADARIDEAGRGRMRRHWLREQLREEATVHGVLVDLAERGADVALQLATGTVRHGHLVLVGRDLVGLMPHDRSLVLVVSSAIVAVRTPPATAPTVGEPRDVGGPTLADVLADLAGERQPVTLGVVHTGHGQHLLTGVLRWVGRDLAVLAVDGGDGPATTYVPLDAVVEVALR